MGWTLDELGAEYVLLDRVEFPRNKPCAGVLSPKIHSLVKIPDDIIDRKLVGYRVHGPPDTIVESKFPEPGCIVQRSKFDNYLIEGLKNKPIINQVLEINDNEDYYLIKGRTEDIKARYIIGADGATSIARKFIGSQASQIAISAQYEFSLYEKEVSERIGDWFEVFYLMEYGYGWLSPMKDGMKVGIGILASKKPAIWEMLESFLDNPLVNSKVEGATLINKEAHSIPMSGPLDILSSGRILLTGDAGGFVYPGTGEGIYYAMKSGQIAAELAYENLANQTNLDDEYNKRLEAAGLLSLRDAEFIEKNLASPEHAEKYIKKLKFLASRS